MIRNLSTIEIKVGERVYRFLCEVDAPIGEVHDVIMQMKGIVIQKMNEAHDAMVAAQTPKDIPKVEEN